MLTLPLRPIFWAISIVAALWLPIVAESLSDLIVFGLGWW